MASLRTITDNLNPQGIPGEGKTEQVETDKTAISELLKNELFSIEEKGWDFYEKMLIDESILTYIGDVLSEPDCIVILPKKLSAKNLVETIGINSLKDMAEELDIAAMKKKSGAIDYRNLANYLFLQGVKAGETSCCAMLGWYCWEKNQLSLANELFDISLMKDTNVNNIARVGKCLIEMEQKKTTLAFKNQYDFLMSNTSTFPEWHQHISRWLWLFGDKFKTSNHTEGHPNLAKAKHCYRLAMAFDPTSSLVIKRFNTVGLFAGDDAKEMKTIVLHKKSQTSTITPPCITVPTRYPSVSLSEGGGRGQKRSHQTTNDVSTGEIITKKHRT